MKLIGSGFARTGTTSLMAALDALGHGPCYHMNTIFANPSHIAFWQAATDGQPVDWQGQLAGYQSSLDWPASMFYEQLLRVYPDAKVLHSVRDPERWYESVVNTIYAARKTGTAPVDPGAYFHLIDSLIYDGLFKGRFEDKAYALSVFDRFTQEVRERIPGDKLLVYDVKEGWEPLCRFLGVEVPDQPFPNLNDTAAFRQRIMGAATGRA